MGNASVGSQLGSCMERILHLTNDQCSRTFSVNTTKWTRFAGFEAQDRGSTPSLTSEARSGTTIAIVETAYQQMFHHYNSSFIRPYVALLGERESS